MAYDALGRLRLAVGIDGTRLLTDYDAGGNRNRIRNRGRNRGRKQGRVYSVGAVCAISCRHATNQSARPQI